MNPEFKTTPLRGQDLLITEFVDIRNKKQRYILIGNNFENRILINIGQKNYDLLKQLSNLNTSVDIPDDLD